MSSMVLRESEDGSPAQLVWRDEGRWLQASFGVLGPVGAMRVLAPSLLIRRTDASGNLLVRLSSLPHLSLRLC